MCLGVPSKIIRIDAEKLGEVDYLGTRVKASFQLLEDPRVGDWVIVHAGFAISRLDEDEAKETLAILREIAEAENP